MPYIDHCGSDYPNNAGELNHAISRMLGAYALQKGISYQTINDVSGACTEALAEFRRRFTYQYEELKRSVNGDLPEYISVQEALKEKKHASSC